MRADLPLITEGIALYAPVHPVYDVTKVISDIPVMTSFWWGLDHAAKLTLIPILCILEVPLMIISASGALVTDFGKRLNIFGGDTFGLATFFWSKNPVNKCRIDPTVTHGAYSLGITWDWHSNHTLHDRPVSWGWFGKLFYSSTEPYSISTMFTDPTAEDGETKTFSRRRRLMHDSGKPSYSGKSHKRSKGSSKGKGKVSTKDKSWMNLGGKPDLSSQGQVASSEWTAAASQGSKVVRTYGEQLVYELVHGSSTSHQNTGDKEMGPKRKRMPKGDSLFLSKNN